MAMLSLRWGGFWLVIPFYACRGSSSLVSAFFPGVSSPFSEKMRVHVCFLYSSSAMCLAALLGSQLPTLPSAHNHAFPLRSFPQREKQPKSAQQT